MGEGLTGDGLPGSPSIGVRIYGDKYNYYYDS